ncbi:ORF6N domain-containing protein [Clostridium sporogenes]|uniref:ORF6N domain-containing protein n=1 Tax=Clostridium sporogenes TaxID=1509 RepID=UPI0013D573E6|nr:ORF6N domain-containing protein [Clostridium sporogenes]NFG01738.1 ORF6N domain-containing protein [Clostridium sporogenes]
MSNLVKINNQDLQIKEIKGQRVVTFKDIDILHERVEGTANKRFLDNQKHFIKDTDYFEFTGDDLKEIKRLPNFGIGLNASKAIFITESGYLMLVKSLTDDLAWKVQRELVNNYFRVKQQKVKVNQLSPELQMFKQIFDSVAKQQLEQQQIKAEVKETKEEVQAIRDVIKLDTTSWRKEVADLITKMAINMGGHEHIKHLRQDSYMLLEQRLKCSLSTRLTNKRRRMADEGICKSKRDKLNKLDIIGEDVRLLEGYLAIVKEMVIKYGI